MNARQSVQTWIAEGRTICPFATLAQRERQIRYVQLVPARRTALIWRELRAFVEKREQAVVFLLTPPDPPTWDAGQRAVCAIFEEIVVAVSRLGNPHLSIEALRKNAARDRAWAEARNLRRLPRCPSDDYLPVHEQRGFLFAIGMGPQYPAEHPRYAPHTLVQCTWQGDITRAMCEYPALQRRIDERMLASVGGVYDADELWLPVVPEVAPRRPRMVTGAVIFPGSADAL